jgi:hypothetical protein
MKSENVIGYFVETIIDMAKTIATLEKENMDLKYENSTYARIVENYEKKEQK